MSQLIHDLRKTFTIVRHVYQYQSKGGKVKASIRKGTSKKFVPDF
jgi:hypothetical protein